MIVEGGDYEHTLAISSVHEGVTIDYRPGSLPAIYAKVLGNQPFEACEFSLSNYMTLRDQGQDWLTAIPVFVNRSFRHSAILVRKDSKLRAFKELAGKKVGVADYSMTAAVWARGLLRDAYGVHWNDINWVSSATPRFPPPPSARVTPSTEDLETLLQEGKIDALLHPQTRDSKLPASQRKFRPLLEDFEAAEKQYFLDTGIYPINHVVVIRREAIAREANAPKAVFEAYSASKKKAVQRRLGTTFIPWADTAWNRTIDLFGDPFPYGWTDINRKVVNTLATYVHEQKLVDNPVAVEALFEPQSLQWRESKN
jgi:4,5-dihydroxyphthalate decarboxylase